MKKLLILPLLVLLTGCVTYYYPETAFEDGVYYAEDDPSYDVYSDAYAGVAFYPWSSLDYFYLGYNPYPGYSFGYGYGGGFAFGISYGYSPWYYPYHNHGYYSPWYASYYYSYYPAWRPYHGYYSHHGGGHYKSKNKYGGNEGDRYAGNGHTDRQDMYTGRQGEKNDGANRRDQEHVSDRDISSNRRYVSTTPAGHSGDRGMVIRSREATKITKSKIHLDRSVPASGINASTSGTRAPSHSNKGSAPTRTITRQAAPKRPPASSNSRPPAKSQAKASSRNKSRPPSSSSNSNRKSKSKTPSLERNQK